MSAAVKIYSSAWCPYCIRAKQLLASKNVSYDEVVVDGQPALRAQMVQESGQRTVPQIWIDQFHVGGCDDLFQLESNKMLDSLLSR